jgi:hypothetical protein
LSPSLQAGGDLLDNDVCGVFVNLIYKTEMDPLAIKASALGRDWPEERTTGEVGC